MTAASTEAIKGPAYRIGLSLSGDLGSERTRVAETSQVSREIGKYRQRNQASGEMAGSSDHVGASAGEFTALAEALPVAIAHLHA